MMNLFLIIAIVVIPVLFGVYRSYKEMALAIVAVALALSFANIDKFRSFKGAGFEAELRTAVKEAYAAIDQLKELGITLSTPILDEMAVSSTPFWYIKTQHKLVQAQKIADTLEKLGASKNEIENVCETFYERIESRHIVKVLNALRETNPEKAYEIKKLLQEEVKGWDKVKLDKYISENQLVMDIQSKEYYSDLEYYLKFRKLRREDKWEG